MIRLETVKSTAREVISGSQDKKCRGKIRQLTVGMDGGECHGPKCGSPIRPVSVNGRHQKRCRQGEDSGDYHKRPDLDARDEYARDYVDACAYDYHRQEADG
ncbi:MAG: hypothetical protein L6R42_010836, partial [Xanthoria sp. 1 TBL-2021]